MRDGQDGQDGQDGSYYVLRALVVRDFGLQAAATEQIDAMYKDAAASRGDSRSSRFRGASVHPPELGGATSDHRRLQLAGVCIIKEMIWTEETDHSLNDTHPSVVRRQPLLRNGTYLVGRA